ncbi:MAG: spore cortex biosynthesis protein YabQ [Acutalibacteraceae bacterium]
MELTIYQQTIAFLWSFAVGLCIAVVYTVVAMLRVIFKPSKAVLFGIDLAFMSFAAIITFLYSISVTMGVVRWYVVFGELIACAVFYFTVGQYLKKSTDFIFNAIKRFFDFVFRPVFRFTAFLRKKICGFWEKRKKNMKKNHIFSKFHLHCHKKMLYNTKEQSVQK